MGIPEWASQHVNIAGWGALLTFVWRAQRLIGEWQSKANEIHKVITNHLPHALAEHKAAMEQVKEAVTLHDNREVNAAAAMSAGVDRISAAIRDEGRETRNWVAAIIKKDN